MTVLKLALQTQSKDEATRRRRAEVVADTGRPVTLYARPQTFVEVIEYPKNSPNIKPAIDEPWRGTRKILF